MQRRHTILPVGAATSSRPANMFENILVAINLAKTDSWSAALPVAVSLARDSAAHLTLGTIIPQWVSARDADWSWDADRRMEDVARYRLEQIARERNCTDFGLHVAWGSVPSAITEMADDTDADLIVLGSHRPTFLDFLRQSNEMKVARRAHCSVLIVRDGSDSE